MAELRDGIPDGVDPAAKERHLSDAEFARVFGCDKDTFGSMPKWKRNNLKKKQGLF